MANENNAGPEARHPDLTMDAEPRQPGAEARRC